MEYKDNIMTYLKWRGDLSLAEAPFNEVDALILAELSYVELDGIVPGVGEKRSIPIGEAGRIYEELHPIEELEKNIQTTRYTPFLMLGLKDCRRFSEMTLSNYVNEIDYEKAEQFAAMHINLGNGMTYIAFRGTDDTLIGWKENFNMSFMMPVPAQASAVEYVNASAKGLFTKFMIGGHSKGGNLAIYAGVFCNPAIQKKIIRVFSFDGPGFNRVMVDDPEYRRMEHKIATYVPESSMIGMLMEHQEKYFVVKSNEVGILQHDGMSWMIDGSRFCYAEGRDKSSRYVDHTLSSWLSQIGPEEREQFIEAFFSVLEAAGIHYLSDLSGINIKKIGSILKVMSTTTPENREIILRIMKLLIEEGSRNLSIEMKEGKKKYQ